MVCVQGRTKPPLHLPAWLMSLLSALLASMPSIRDGHEAEICTLTCRHLPWAQPLWLGGLAAAQGEGSVLEPPLAAASLCLHHGWEQNQGSEAFRIQGVSVHFAEHWDASSCCCRAASLHGSKSQCVFNWERVLLSKSICGVMAPEICPARGCLNPQPEIFL